VTADSTETAPVSASASVAVDQRPDVTLTKTPGVSSVDAAGDVITYTITAQNTWNVTLSGVTVEDSQVTVVTEIVDPGAPILGPEWLGQVLDGDYNVGDTNQNGIEDPGETFEFRNVGDTNLNGIEDPGETFLLTNVGDTNQNGFQDDGETFQYYNAGDTNHNGVEDDGETFQFTVSHAATSVDANNDTFNDGDADFDGQLDVGETWQYTVSYTVTQDDIDNGGVVQIGLTHDNTATVTTAQGAGDEASASVDIEQKRVSLVKTASVPGDTADAAGEVIDYTITITNDGNVALTPTVNDPSVIDLAAVMSGTFNAGDADMDGVFDPSESWQYAASHTVTQAEMDAGGTIDNTASVTTGEGASASGGASVTVEQNAEVTLVKSALGYHDLNNNNVADAGDTIDFQFLIENVGNITLHDVGVNDVDTNVVVTGAVFDLAPGASDSTSWVGVYTITALDVGNGYHDNDAVALADEASDSSGTVHVVLANLMLLV